MGGSGWTLQDAENGLYRGWRRRERSCGACARTRDHYLGHWCPLVPVQSLVSERGNIAREGKPLLTLPPKASADLRPPSALLHPHRRPNRLVRSSRVHLESLSATWSSGARSYSVPKEEVGTETYCGAAPGVRAGCRGTRANNRHFVLHVASCFADFSSWFCVV